VSITSRNNIGLQWEDGFLTREEVKIHFSKFNVLPGKTKRYIVFLHGLGESASKYNHIAEDLNLDSTTGYLSIDLRGHGRSSGEELHIDSYDDYEEDLCFFIKNIVRDKQYIIIAHSTGALISLYCLAKKTIKPQKLLLSSVFLGIKYPTKLLPNTLFHIIIRIATLLGLSKWRFPSPTKNMSFVNNPYTTSKLRFDEIMKDKRYLRGPSLSWVHASLQAIKFVSSRKNIKNINQSINIFLPLRDLVVDSKATFKWCKKLRLFSQIPLLSIVFFNSKHEIFYEQDRIYKKAIKLLRVWIL
jgi:alpha-beta hydrolase superfamily lysophospholipase